jgi:histidinol-phosphate/aromatic aminotransferase/cobyric acid decarboxylase-like protein
MRRFLDYYRQFEELSPEEHSRGLRERRDEEKRRALTEVPPLDMASSEWHEPPHPEIVNAATFALRRAVNAYPDRTAAPLREALAARHGVEPDQVVAGHGASGLLWAAFGALLGAAPHGAGPSRAAGAAEAVAPHGAPRRAAESARPEVLVAWPTWGPLPRLVADAGGEPVPVPLGADGAADTAALRAAAGPGTRAVALASPNDPTGAAVSAEALAELAAGLPEDAWLVLDAALAAFAPDGPDALAGHARTLVVYSFSKAHAMAGFRAGYAIGPPGAEALLERLGPPLGVSAPAQAGMAWAAESGERVVALRRAHAFAERERLAAALAGTPFAFPAGHGHLVWLSSAEHDGRELAAGLAAWRIYVTPGTAWGNDRHVRVALRDSAATDRLVAALLEL